jgi:hypothetical protein
MGRLLDRYDAMQRLPLGATSSLRDDRGGTAGSQYRRQGAAYGQALRILNRNARRGDARSAMAAIGVREDAMSRGFAPGGIQRREEVDGASAGFRDSMEQGARDMEQAAAVDRRARGQFLSGESTVNPNATRVGQPRILSTPSFEELTPPRQATDFAPGANITNPAGGIQLVGNANPDGTSREFPTTVNPSPAGGIGTLPQERPVTDVTGAPKVQRVSMIDGRPASEVLAEMRTAAATSDAVTAGAPKAKPVDIVDDYLASVEGYQAGLNGDGDPDAAGARATKLYENASELDKARMSGALMKRAAELNKSQGYAATPDTKRKPRILKRR